jgi:hypothetical protein
VGGGILVRNSSSLTLMDTIVSDNIAAENGGGIMKRKDASVIVRDNFIADNNNRNV